MRRRLAALAVLICVLAPIGATADYRRVSVGRVLAGVAQGKISGGYALAVAYIVDWDSVRGSGRNASHERHIYLYGCILVVRNGKGDISCDFLKHNQFTIDPMLEGSRLSFSLTSLMFPRKKLTASITITQNGQLYPEPWVEPPYIDDLPAVWTDASAAVIRPAKVSGTIRSEKVGGGKLQASKHTSGYMYRAIGAGLFISPT